MTLRPRYALAALVLFGIEVLIALFVRDGFVRPYLGDVLAVLLVHLALRAFTRMGPRASAVAALATGFAVELAQFAGLADLAPLRDWPVARVVLGVSFAAADLVAYCAGAVAAFAIEALVARRGQAIV